MKRRPVQLALVALAYLAAGAVLTVVVAAACALWSPLSDPYERHFSFIPKHAERIAPDEWVRNQWDRRGNAPEHWYSIEARELQGLGISSLCIQASPNNRAFIDYHTSERVRLVRVGWPFRWTECTSSVEKMPDWSRGWPRDTTPITAYKPAIPLGAVWGASPRFPTRLDSSLAMDFALGGRHMPLSVRPFAFTASAVAWSIVLAALAYSKQSLVASLRLRRGLCPRCAYPIGASANCTECGHVLPDYTIKQPAGASTA